MSRRGRGGRNRNGGNNGGNRGGQNNRGDNRNQGRQQHATSDDNRPQGQQQQVDRSGGKVAFQSALQPKKTISRPPSAATAAVAPQPATRTYKAVYFDTITQAKSDLSKLKEIASQCDQLNIIVRAEASMDDPDLTSIGKLFCGAAWALIHDRRTADGWYNEPHE
jgi:hypothetical protein